MAIPLCLPNNYRWNATTGECSKIGEGRSSLVIVDEALQQLRNLKGKTYEIDDRPNRFIASLNFDNK